MKVRISGKSAKGYALVAGEVLRGTLESVERVETKNGPRAKVTLSKAHGVAWDKAPASDTDAPKFDSDGFKAKDGATLTIFTNERNAEALSDMLGTTVFLWRCAGQFEGITFATE